MTLNGGVYQASGPRTLALALAGAPMEAKVLGLDGTEQRLQLPLSWTLRTGDRLILGRTHQGARTYLAAQGGWQTRLRLGSRSSEQGLRAGDTLPAEPAAIPTRHPGVPGWEIPTVEPFRIIDGPDARTGSEWDDWFWAGRRFRVGARSDRMGLRLEGDPVTIVHDPHRLSTPVAPGTIQVAGSQLIVLGVACGTMGGYPHVAHVISADLDRLGQLRPGDVIGFQRVSLEAARHEDRDLRRSRKTLLTRVAVMAKDAR
jgi:allophanate hydrolase subunit 2